MNKIMNQQDSASHIKALGKKLGLTVVKHPEQWVIITKNGISLGYPTDFETFGHLKRIEGMRLMVSLFENHNSMS